MTDPKTLAQLAANMRPDCPDAQARLVTYLSGRAEASRVLKLFAEHGPEFARGFDDTINEVKNGG